jgi:hypothetical protein
LAITTGRLGFSGSPYFGFGLGEGGGLMVQNNPEDSTDVFSLYRIPVKQKLKT